MLLYSSGHAHDAGLAALKAGVFRKTVGSVICKKEEISGTQEESSDEREELLEHSKQQQHFTSWLYSWTYPEQ